VESLWLERPPALRHGVASAMVLIVGGLPLFYLARGGVPTHLVVAVESCAVLAGAVLAIRAERAAVWCQPDVILLRGYLRSRRIAVSDVVGVRGDRLYWCGRYGALRSTRMTGIAEGPSRFPIGDTYRTSGSQRRMEAWIEQAVGGRLKNRGRSVAFLGDEALARELKVVKAGVRLEARRRWLVPADTKKRWRTLLDRTTSELAKRQATRSR
jgi:hypothetical protein